MKLAASQIAWQPEEEHAALGILQKHGFAGVEGAPTRMAGPTPYSDPQNAAPYRALAATYGLAVCSLQSIWYGQDGSMFGPERAALLAYTQQAVNFAAVAGAGNLVFGCPKNRVLPPGVGDDSAVDFFAQLAASAAAHGTVLSLEANPPVYGTNFMNTTRQAADMVCRVNHPGCRLNLDFGTLLINEEPVEQLVDLLPLVHHVHISEPGLAAIRQRAQHGALAALLRAAGYGGYVSIEMKAQPLAVLDETAAYLAEVFA